MFASPVSFNCLFLFCLFVCIICNLGYVISLSLPLASYLMAYRTVLKTSEDFYEALRSSREIATILTERLRNATGTKAAVRPYSYPDVFYEQYLTMWPDTVKSLGISIGAIFLVTFLFLGLDFYSALIVAVTILMIIVDLMAMMYWWDISLNAISLVNLVVVSGGKNCRIGIL